MQIEYLHLDVVQLRFLRLHSHSATQSLHLHSYAESAHLHFVGDSGSEIRLSSSVSRRSSGEVKALYSSDQRGKPQLYYIIQYRIIIKPKFLLQTQIRFSGKGDEMNLLPIRDLRLSAGDEHLHGFTAVIGPLCFL